MTEESNGRLTVADALMQALVDGGVTHCFINTGTDYPALIESWARAAQEGRRMPQLVVCPHEVVAISAAHGMAASTGRPVAVLVHVDVGTENLGGGIHNAARGRVPLVVFAGASPFTQEGERPGSRDHYIQFLQDVPDQRGIVRQYVKWDYELKTGANVPAVVFRALQIAASAPAGPVYLVGAREVLEEPARPVQAGPDAWPPAGAGGLGPADVRRIADALAAARFPVLITSYLGRSYAAVEAVVALSERWAVGVLESRPQYLNFPTDHPHHLGFDSDIAEALAQADLVLLVDVDVPWIPARERPRGDATVLHIDQDPLKERMPLWYFPAAGVFRADAAVALTQIAETLAARPVPPAVAARRFQLGERHHRLRAQWTGRASGDAGALNPEWVLEQLGQWIDADTVVVNEAVTQSEAVSRYLGRRRPGTWFASGGSSLGWGSGAALGVKLAEPDRPVVLVSGDGSYLFGNPAAVHWTARRYGAPFLTVILNNRGWGAVKGAVLSVHPEGAAARAGRFYAGFEEPGDWAAVAAAAGGALARVVRRPEDLRPAWDAAQAALAEGRAAVLDVYVTPVEGRPGEA
jgi:acetolactate synthase-1/2/3 large subunit